MSEVKSDVVIVNNEYITMKFVTDGPYIYHIIHKPIEFEVFRDALNKGTDFLKENGCVKWLSDDRKNKNSPPSEEMSEHALEEWLLEEWIPRTIQAGWKLWAVIVPTDVISAGSMIPVINNLYEYGLRMMVYDNKEEAVEWLKSN